MIEDEGWYILAGGMWIFDNEQGKVEIEEQTLSDGSKAYNAHIPAQIIYCRTQIAAINLVSENSISLKEKKTKPKTNQ